MRRSAEVAYIKKFAERIKNRRLELGISQEELSDKVNCHINHLGKIERGQVDPSLSIMYKIAKALTVDLKDLIP